MINRMARKKMMYSRRLVRSSTATTNRRGYIKLLASLGVSAAAIGLLKQSGLLDKLVPVSGPQALEEAKISAAAHAWGMVIDLSKCIGCNACVINCKIVNQVPRGQFRTIVNEVNERGSRYFLPLPCMHCENPPCVRSCPTGASHRRDDGIVLINPDLCIACKVCMSFCPYYVTGNGPVRFINLITGVCDKCDFCFAKRYPYRDGEPACVEACPTGARIFGDFNDPNSEVSKSLRTRRIVFRLKERLGTLPRVYYVGEAIA